MILTKGRIMKRYTIEKIIYVDGAVDTIKTAEGRDLHLTNNKYTNELKVGDKIGIMYDYVMGVMPMAYIYKDRLFLDYIMTTDSAKAYRDTIKKLNFFDRQIFNFYAMKSVAQSGEIPHLATWRNLRTMERIRKSR